jgi:hypothetical protein
MKGQVLNLIQMTFLVKDKIRKETKFFLFHPSQIYNNHQQNRQPQQQLQQPPPIVESLININDTDNDKPKCYHHKYQCNNFIIIISYPIPFSSLNINTYPPNSTQQYQTSNQTKKQTNSTTSN